MAGAVLVSVLPRMSGCGESMLVAVDPASLEPLAIRRFPAEEYLDPHRDRIEHCRGLAVADDTLLVAMFNSVREFRIDDGRRLLLRAGAQRSHVHAVDIHGICARFGRVLAASTGTDQLIDWSLRSSDQRVIGLDSAAHTGDMRFPLEVARSAGAVDWREVLPGSRHLNSVALIDSDTVVAVGLTSLFVIRASGVTRLHHEPGALFHDAHAIDARTLVVTNAALGEVVSVDIETARIRRVAVADPAETFLRGLCVVGDFAFALGSCLGESSQRYVPGRGRPTPGTGWFEVFVLDLASWQVRERTVVWLDDSSAGSVAYAAVVVGQAYALASRTGSPADALSDAGG